MTPVDALAAFDRRILETYSRRTTDALRAMLPLRVALPFLDPFLALNVAKEVAKDALVIRRAGARHAGTVRQLFEATREIDRSFLARAGGIPVGIVIRYEEIEPIRLRRIERLLGAADAILAHWPQRRGARAALRASHSRAEFEGLLLDLLQLHALETRALSRALRMPALLVPLREQFGVGLHQVMNDAAAHLARELTATVYRSGRA